MVRGWDGVLWNQPRGDFPYSKGFLPIVLSWFFSPIIGGGLSSIIFLLNRHLVLRRDNSTMKAIWSLPILLFFTCFINVMFVLAKGAKNEMAKTWPCNPKAGPGMFNLTYEDCSNLYAASAWIGAAVGLSIAVIGSAIGIPLLIRQHNRNLVVVGDAETGKAITESDADSKSTEESNKALEFPPFPQEESLVSQAWWYLSYVPRAFLLQCRRGLFYDIFAHSAHDSDS